ncbi:hypothetical protein Q7P37_001136 [Cladosporium fusiforme]
MENDYLMSPELHNDPPKRGGMRQHFTSSSDSTRTPSNGREDMERTPKGPTYPGESELGSEETDCEKDSMRPPPASTKLGFSGYILVLALFYTALTLFAWVILCILTYRPLVGGLKHYGVTFDGAGDYGQYINMNNSHAEIFNQSGRYFRAAEVIRSVVTILTIPLTSAVCSKAAVVYSQQRRGRALSLRQTMALADRGWTDPHVFLKLLSGGWKQHASKLLFLAIFLNIFGAVIAPLQSFWLSTTTIKRPNRWQPLNLTDISDFDIQESSFTSGGMGEEQVLHMRAALTTTNNVAPQIRLWMRQPDNCVELDGLSPSDMRQMADLDSDDLPAFCTPPVHVKNFGNMRMLPDPFLAQMPSDYSTGLIRQYLLRLNSTAHRDVITEAEFPANCDSIPDAFYARYAGNVSTDDELGPGVWSLEACMPTNATESPWLPTRDRQDFSEHLYLNISADDPYNDDTPGGYFKVTLNTTAGYFELPNYMNGQQPGPLLDHDPTDSCRAPEGNCSLQNSKSKLNNADVSATNFPRQDERDSNLTVSDTTLRISIHHNRGPLVMIAMALFGPGSFIEDRTARPAAHLFPNQTSTDPVEHSRFQENCMERAPFVNLLRPDTDLPRRRPVGSGGIGPSGLLDECLDRRATVVNNIQEQLFQYVKLFFWNEVGVEGVDYNGFNADRIANAFTSAAFLANDVWLNSANGNTWQVLYDYGVDIEKPVMSLAGIITISVMIGVFLTLLLGLATYAAFSARWTDQLDSFALLRIGASIHGDIQFRATQNAQKVEALDRLPGWIGDVTEGAGEVGRLALGGNGRLDGRRKFEAYDVDETEHASLHRWRLIFTERLSRNFRR